LLVQITACYALGRRNQQLKDVSNRNCITKKSMCPTLRMIQPYTIESTRDARISETILLGWLSLSFMMLSMTESSVAVVSCKPHNYPLAPKIVIQ